ncbi:Prophage integrase IntA [Ephemeroptericola cinctiostellae]|uniref:Prophage integrase IntA n=1 Tax=Ephemeroptericola cinctiostellae TaxID=2268024 RepID=A0A345DE99_9BURK|nr:integrase arm-type DNA-binding domain-containing protein [Ephemeroptericola cinctiostellae]AXF86687.1 Prophage integrase IntA [Ephemeroptericola cinctiostellae]
MLTDRELKGLKPDQKQYKKYDSDGLLMIVTPAGGKLWRYRYKFGGKDLMMALGKYPAVSLLDARRLRDDCARLLSEGKNPADFKRDGRIEADGLRFEVVAREWLESNRPNWVEAYYLRTRRIVVEDLAAELIRPIDSIEPPHVLAAMLKIEKRGSTETAIRARALASRIFCYAIARGYCKFDAAAPLSGAIIAKPVVNMPAITEPREIGRLMRNIRDYQGFAVRNCLLFNAYTFMRPAEARMLEWAEIDWDAQRIEVPAEKMKMDLPLVVPMSAQVVDLLRSMQQVTGRDKYVFASKQSNVKHRKPISNATALKALRLMGYKADEMVVHGLRSMASTSLYESNMWRGEVIERQLAHVEKNKVKGAYNRAMYIDERTKMMQWYADFLDELAGK